MDKLTAKSALHPNYKAGIYGANSDQPVCLTEVRGKQMTNLIAFDQDAVNQCIGDKFGLTLPSPGESATNGQRLILWTAPKRYLIVCPNEDNLVKHLASNLTDAQAALQDLSSARTIVRLSGVSARQIMAKGLMVNLDAASFVSGQLILSSFDHHYPAIIHNVSDDQDRFDIYITRSFALSFWHWLTDSALEFGYEITESGNDEQKSD